MEVSAVYQLQSEYNSSYYMTWNAGNDVSQADVSPSYPYQDWDFGFEPLMVCLANPKDSAKSLFSYGKLDETNTSAYQIWLPDNWCMWVKSVNLDGSYSFQNNQNGKYLACAGAGSVTLTTTIVSSAKWVVVTTDESPNYNGYSNTISGVTYYLRADYDNHSMYCDTGFTSSCLQYLWILFEQGAYTLMECDVSPIQMLKSNGDGTVGFTTTVSNACFWVPIKRNPANMWAFLSVNGGYLTANTDLSTISETTGGATPSTPGGLTSTALFDLTQVDPPLKSKKRWLKALLTSKGTGEGAKEFSKKLNQLEELGFEDKEQNINALLTTKGCFLDAVKFLTQLEQF